MTTPSHTPARSWVLRAILIVLVCALLSTMSKPSLAGVLRAQAGEATTTVAIGESNSAAQRAELLAVFGVEDSSAVVEVTVTETLTAWDGVFDLTGVDSAYSSTAVTCAGAGSGVMVSTRNIEVVPPELYALALVTAGLTDVELVVAAPDDAVALGMTALTGVFKTWDLAPCSRGADDPVRRDLALRELALVASIGEAHGGTEAVRSTTDLLLGLQRDVVTGRISPADFDGEVASRADDLGLGLTGDEQTGVVAFLGLLVDSDVDWDTFSADWTVDQLSETRVAMRPGTEQAETSETESTGVPAGVGGETRPLPTVAPTSTARVIVTPTETPVVEATATAALTPVVTVTAPPVVGGTDPSGGDSTGSSVVDQLPSPWWLLVALLPLAWLAVLLMRRRHRPLLIVRGRRPVSTGAVVAHRRAAESMAVATVLRGEPVMQPTRQRSTVWRRRPGRVVE